jgi:ectoine hydroxylase-related dioxygenase (phytanoyl-CoA dioxygenase family)
VNTIWAIDDLSAANGAPRIIPGTHLRPELPEEVLDDPELAHPMRLCLPRRPAA